MQLIYRTARESVSNCVGHSLHVPNVTCELGDVVEMTNLAWSVLVGIGGECECQRFVVCKNIELTTFDEVAKVLDGKVHCKELSVKCAVPGFWWTEHSGEIGNWMPPVTNTLLQDSSHCTIGSIGHNACRSVWFRVDEESGGGQGFFDGYESGCGFAIPNELLPVLFLGGQH